MPPPIPEHQKRYTANPSRPARYRPGKAVPEEESSEEDEEEEQVQQKKQPAKKSQSRSAASGRHVAPVEDEDEDDEEGFVTEDEDEVPGGAPVVSTTVAQKVTPAATTITSTAQAQRIQQSEAEDEEDDEESEDEESESEEESSSEDEAPQRKFQRPTFIKKTDRQRSQSHAENTTDLKATPAPETVSSHHGQDVAARRLDEAEKMIKLTIERDTAARLAGKKAWDDDEDLPQEALVDDTDGIDAEAEHSAWRLRELHRLKRDREVMVAREKELEEIERRRNLTAEERDAEDKEFIDKQKADREEGRGKAALLSKYHHKGAFFMDDEDSKRLAQRDLVGAKFADDVDKSTLPEYMQIRDMTKLGKKGRTRYTDLKGQDTGRFGDDVKRWRGSGYNNRDGPRDDTRGLDERFLPDNDRGGPAASGANASAVGIRRERRRSRSNSPDRDRAQDHGGRDRHRPHSRSRSRSQDRRRRRYSSSRSRSPKRSGSLVRGSRRHRSSSPYHERDKRRRIET